MEKQRFVRQAKRDIEDMHNEAKCMRQSLVDAQLKFRAELEDIQKYSYDPRHILPEEIIIDILSMVQEPLTLDMASLAHPFFKQIIKTYNFKVHRLFEKIVGLPKVATFLNDRGLLIPLRGVSKSLKMIVEQLDGLAGLNMNGSITIDSLEAAQTFLESYDPEKTNSAKTILQKVLHVSFEAVGTKDLDNFVNLLLTKIMPVVGSQVKGIRFDANSSDYSLTESRAYSVLVEMTKMCSKLQYVRAKVQDDAELDGCLEDVVATPFPKIPSLRKLFLTEISSRLKYNPFHLAILHSNLHIEDIDCTYCAVIEEPISDLFCKLRLQTFSVILDSKIFLDDDIYLIDQSNQDQYLVRSFMKLKNILRLTWPLSQIKVKCHSLDGVSIADLFSIISCFRGLKTVTLDLKWIKHVEENTIAFRIPIDLPNLQCISMNTSHLSSLDFLSKCSRLIQISLTSENDDELHRFNNLSEASKHLLEIRGFLSRLYESNIWRMFKYLSTVRIERNGKTIKCYCKNRVLCAL